MTTLRELNIYRPKRWARKVTVEPAVEPVLLEEMKNHARLEAPEDEALLQGNIVAARRWAEHYTNRAFISQTWTLKLAQFPDTNDAVIELMGGTVQSVTSIVYTDTDGAPQTVDAGDYVVDGDWEPGRVGLAFDKAWPSGAQNWDLPVTITYVVGYGDNPGDVPEEIRAAIRMVALELFENRQESIAGISVSSVPWGARMLIAPYRIIRLA